MCQEILKFPKSQEKVRKNGVDINSFSVSGLPCERPGFGPRTRLREIIPANNCTMQGQNNWGNWGSPDVMKLWVAWEVLRWLMKFRELCSGDFHPKLLRHPTMVSSMWTLPQVPIGKHNNRQHASPHHEVDRHRCKTNAHLARYY